MKFFVCSKSELCMFQILFGRGSSSAKYPFHWIRNERVVRVPQWHRIFLILYSSSPLIRSGGGDGKSGPWMVFT